MNHTDPRIDGELRPDLQRLLAETRDAYEPPSSSRARAHWAIEQRLSVREKPWFVPRPRALLAALALGLVTAGATAALLGSWSGGSSGDDARPAEARPPLSPVPPEPVKLVSSPLEREGDIEQPSAEPPSNLESRSGSGQGATGARSPAPAPRVDARESLRAELDLLRKVNAAQRSGDPATALGLLEAFSKEKGPGVLVEERDAARIVALCSLGRADEGRARLTRFEARFPSSPQLARARSLCAK